MSPLARRVWRADVQFLLALGVLLFVSAGSLYYWQAWLYLAVFALGMVLASGYFLRHDPQLVERRMGWSETRPRQRRLRSLAGLTMVAVYLVPALGWRWQGAALSAWAVVLAHGLQLIGWWLVYRVLLANHYASSTIQVEAGQTLVDTGPYAWVRHPMYAGGLLVFLATPLALASWWGLLPILGFAAVLMARLLDEELVLATELPGYVEYCRRVRYRLIPFVW
ncbi:isoprenylcysteine carboxylmethyltransferase family protein [Neisseriaceae bacterium JH1-16]|nr:isoprenylcysteine carboxylmethyltransferase family protein [Neisseriaceae bacterium JH1-16]